jgi:hypothetical protein
MDIILDNLVAAVSEKNAEIQEELTNVSTTAALAAVGNAINTTDKYKGKQVFNETTGILVIAAGPDADDVWKNAGTGATAHTPV